MNIPNSVLVDGLGFVALIIKQYEVQTVSVLVSENPVSLSPRPFERFPILL